MKGIFQLPWFKAYQRAISTALLFVFILSFTITPTTGYAQSVLNLPAPGTMVKPSEAYSLTVLRGVKVDLNNPLVMDFIVDRGDTSLEGEALKNEGQKLVKYFLTAMTVPEDELWVNLSPYEADRMIPEKFGQTEMGRDLLAQDYILKQMTASLSDPDSALGKQFWQRVYERAQKEFGTTDIPTDMFNKVWIMPDKAVVYENGNVAYIQENRLKVMLESDYLAIKKTAEQQGRSTTDATMALRRSDSEALAQSVMREIIIPELIREVNEGKNFANLRQVYHSMLLAYWYKIKVKESILGKAYLNKNKTAGEELDDKTAKDQIYRKYVEAFKKGAYNYIKEDFDTYRQETIPRKYFSGGGLGFGIAVQQGARVAFVRGAPPQTRTNEAAMTVRLGTTGRLDAAMKSREQGFRGNVLPAKERIRAQNFKIEQDDFISTQSFDQHVNGADLVLGQIFGTGHGVKFLQVVNGILPQGYAIDWEKRTVYVEQSLVEMEGSTLLLERLGIMALAKPGEEYEAMFHYAKERMQRESQQKYAQMFPYDPDDLVAQAKAEYYLVGIDQEVRSSLREKFPVGKISEADFEAAVDKEIQQKVRTKYNDVLGPGPVEEVNHSTIALHYELLQRATEAIYMWANAVLDGVVVNKFVSSFSQIKKEVTAGSDNIVFNIEGSKWAPPSGFHRFIPLGMLAETSGMNHRREKGQLMKKWTVVNVANVTVKDGRKPSVFNSFLARVELLDKLFKKTKGFLTILDRNKLYEDYNAEETTALIIARMLRDLLDNRGVKLPEINTADDVTPDLMRTINQELAKLKQDGHEINLIVNYQNGEDHNRVFQRTFHWKEITSEELKVAGIDEPAKVFDLAKRYPKLLTTYADKEIRLLVDVRDVEKQFHEDRNLPDFDPIMAEAFLSALRRSQEMLVKGVELTSGKVGLEEQRFWVARSWEKYKELILGQEEHGEAHISAMDVNRPDQVARKEFLTRIRAAQTERDMLQIFDDAIEQFRQEQKKKENHPEYNMTMPFIPEIDSVGKFFIMNSLVPQFVDVIGCTVIRPGAGSVDIYRDRLLKEGRVKIMPIAGLQIPMSANDARTGFIKYLMGTQDPNLLGVIPETVFTEITPEDWGFLLRSAGNGQVLPLSMEKMLDWRLNNTEQTDTEAFLHRLSALGRGEFTFLKRLRNATIKSGSFELMFSVLERFDEAGKPESLLQIESMIEGNFDPGIIEEILSAVEKFSGGKREQRISGTIDFRKSYLTMGKMEAGKVNFVKPYGATHVQIYRLPASWNQLTREIEPIAARKWREGVPGLDNDRWQLASQEAFAKYIVDPNTSTLKIGGVRSVPKGDSVTMEMNASPNQPMQLPPLADGETYLAVTVDYAQATPDQELENNPLGGINLDMNNMDFGIESAGAGIQFNIDPAMLQNGNFNGLVPVILNVTPITDLPMFLGAKEEKELVGAGV